MKTIAQVIGVFAICISHLCAENLLEARAKHTTKLLKEEVEKEALEEPPAELFKLVKYPAKLGEMAAYLSLPEDTKKKNPAIIWITGGFPAGGGGSYLWENPNIANDQSAQQYRHAGMVMMYPSFRGANANPGFQEGFYGEVDDVISAYDYLSKLSYIDPKRIYLGGHSTGGTLALLVAASTDKFRGVIAMGGVEDPADYGDDTILYDAEDSNEQRLRAPMHFLAAVQSPTLVTEGVDGNADSLLEMKELSDNEKLKFVAIAEADHFNVIYPVNKFLSEALIKDPDAIDKLDSDKLESIYVEHSTSQREAEDLRVLAYYRSQGVDLGKVQTVKHHYYALNKDEIELFFNEAKESKYVVSAITKHTNDQGTDYWSGTIQLSLSLGDMEKVFEVRRKLKTVMKKSEAEEVWYDGWEVE